jgi:hypothetical protein
MAMRSEREIRECFDLLNKIHALCGAYPACTAGREWIGWVLNEALPVEEAPCSQHPQKK